MPAGRPSTLTPEIQARLVEAISAGNFRQVAADYVGVSRRTFLSWIARGKTEPDSIYGEFLHAILKAERAAEMRCVGLILKAAAEDPKNAQWFLERKFPRRWARKDKMAMEHSGADGGPVQVSIAINRTVAKGAK